MNSSILLLVIVLYFAVLLTISYLTSNKADSKSFYVGNKQSPWYIVAFGMIGASLSGVTFISVPGWVGTSYFSYMQMVLGFLLGYAVIANVLLPLYYRLNLTSIYTYLNQRFGTAAYKTGAFFFLLSRTVGAALRLFLVAGVMQYIIFDDLGIPFWLTVAITILLIWVYTFRGGIKTIVWTDSLQTFFMLAAVMITIFTVGRSLDLNSINEISRTISESDYSRIFFFEDSSGPNYFWKQFISGAFICIAMTGLDQDMMQKNLSIKTIGDAKKNMYWFSIVLVFVNLLFLSLGALLFIYSSQKGIPIPERTDYLFPDIAINHIGGFTAIIFFIGLIAAAYSSADSALTSLTTSFTIDILNKDPEDSSPQAKQTRYAVHIGFSIILFLLILWANTGDNSAVISKVYTYAGYTYGPLLGLYAYGLFTKLKAKDQLIPLICIISPILTYLLSTSLKANNFDVGFLLLPINGTITFMGLLISRLFIPKTA